MNSLEEVKFNNIANEIINSLSSFLMNNNYFDSTKEEINQEIFEIVNEIDITNFNINKQKIINQVKKELIKRINKANKEDNVEVQESLKAYLAEIDNYKLLTKEEERELFIKYKNGDLESKETLIKCNLRLVVSIAKMYSGFGIPILDLIQEGNFGLFKAIEGFDYTKGFKLSTYATWWIKQAILRSLESKEKNIRIPALSNNLLLKIRKEEEKFYKSHGTKPTNNDIASALNVSEQDVEEAKKLDFHYKSLNETINEENDFELGDTIESSEVLENEVIDNSLSDEFKKFFKEAELTEDQIFVISHRFGLVDGKEYKFEEIGKMLNKTRERIRQIEIRAFIKLQRCPYKDKIINYYDGRYDTEKVKKKKLY